MSGFGRKRNNRFNAVIRPKRRRKKPAFVLPAILRKIPPLVLVGCSVALVGILALLGIIFFSGQFTPTEVVFEGVSPEMLERAQEHTNGFLSERSLALFPRSTVLFPSSGLSNSLSEAFPRFRVVTVRTELPHTVHILVQERERNGIWCPAGGQATPQCFFYGEDGVIFEEAPNNARGFLLRFVRDERVGSAELGQQVLSEEDQMDLEVLYAAFSHGFEHPSYIIIADEREVRVGFLPQWEARLSRMDDFVPQIENVAIVVEQQIGPRRNELEYIDARLGSRLFYKYRGSEGEQEEEVLQDTQPQEESQEEE